MSSELADKTGQASLRRPSASQFLVGCNRELVGVNVLAVAVEYSFQGKRSRHRCALPAPAGDALQSERPSACRACRRECGTRRSCTRRGWACGSRLRSVMRLPCRPEEVAAGHGCVAFPRGSPGLRHRAEGRLRDWPTEAGERTCWRGRLPGPRAVIAQVGPLKVKRISALNPRVGSFLEPA